MTNRLQRPRNLVALGVLVALALIAKLTGIDLPLAGTDAAPPGAAAATEVAPRPGAAVRDDSDQVLAAFRAQRSDLQVQVRGIVDRVLSDDDEGSRHQRFILELANDHTLLVAHNIDLAPRVPLEAGDELTAHGEYEWNPKGGVLHWTHHDPRGTHVGGWIEHDGTRYE